MDKPIHSSGDTGFLPWPAGALRVYRVETWTGGYIATYATEDAANRRAQSESWNAYRDARVVPLSRSA